MMVCRSARSTKFINTAVRQLATDDQPSNVRELKDAVERAIILAQGGLLQFNPSTSGDFQPGTLSSRAEQCVPS